MAESTISGFIDLVGTREIAKEDRREYHQKLEFFQETLADLCHILTGDQDRLYLFNDSLFFQSERVSNVLSFVRAVRLRLLNEGIYFKGAIGQGGLEPTDAYVLPLARDDEEERVRERKLVGFRFGINAAGLFAEQERLKGIGIVVDKEIHSPSPSADIAYTCFLPQVNSLRAESYLDVTLGPEEQDDEILDRLLRNFFSAKSRSRKYARFYIPLLVLWVQSLDMSEFKEGLPEGGNLAGILLSGRFEQLFGDVSGIENVFLCLLNRFYLNSQIVARPLIYQARKYIIGRRKLTRSLDNIPLEILGRQVRGEFLTDLSADLLGRSPEERQVRETIKDLLAQGTSSNEDIAGELNRLRYPTKMGRLWTRQAVISFRNREGI